MTGSGVIRRCISTRRRITLSLIRPAAPAFCFSASRSQPHAKNPREASSLCGFAGPAGCRDGPLWSGGCFAAWTRALLRARGVWLVGEGIVVVLQERITEAVAADACRCRLALLHRVISAAGHVAGDILPAKLLCVCLISGHRAKRNNGDHCCDRRANFQECLSSSSLHAVGLVAPDRELCRQTNMRPRSSGLEGMTVM
jgi:hypothetical protein